MPDTDITEVKCPACDGGDCEWCNGTGMVEDISQKGDIDNP